MNVPHGGRPEAIYSPAATTVRRNVDRKRLAAGVVVLVVVAVGLAVVSGLVPLGGNAEHVEDFPTDTGTSYGGDGGGGDGGSATTT